MKEVGQLGALFLHHRESCPDQHIVDEQAGQTGGPPLATLLLCSYTCHLRHVHVHLASSFVFYAPLVRLTFAGSGQWQMLLSLAASQSALYVAISS
jgi:hypothetical protein